MLVSVLSLLLAAPAPSPLGNEKLVFLGLTHETGVEPGVAKLLSEVAATHIQSVHENVISGSDITTMLSAEETKAQLGCEDASCLADIGLALGARYLVAGGVGLLGERYILNMKLIDTKTVTVINRVTVSDAHDVDSLVELLGPTVRKLLGASRASAPTEAPGVSASETVSSGGWMSPLSIGGFTAAGVGAIGGAVFAVMAKGKESELKDMSPPTAKQVSQYESLRSTTLSRALVADIFFGVGVVGLGLGITGLLLGDDDNASEGHAQLVVSPSSIAIAGEF